jgi:hypothetical protein
MAVSVFADEGLWSVLVGMLCKCSIELVQLIKERFKACVSTSQASMILVSLKEIDG